MTLQEAKRIFIDRGFIDGIFEGDKWREAVKTLSDWLESEPVEDCISRNKVLEGKVIHQSCDGVEIIDSYAVPVEYIEQLPSIQPTAKENLVVGDCISRAELLKAIDTWDKFGVDDTNSLFRLDNLSLPHYVPYIHYDDVVKAIKGMPSVQPKSMQVELEGDGYSDGELVYDYGKCPKCGWEFEYGDKDWEEPYCCHCGQKLHWFESEDEE